MEDSRRDDPFQRIEAIEDEIYGVKRDNGLRSKVLTMWESFLMAKGILWFIIKACAIGIPCVALLYAFLS